MPESARALLRRPGGQALRSGNPDEFARAILHVEIARFEKTAQHVGPVFFDRGLGDVVGMHVDDSALRKEIADMARQFRYSGPVFRLPAWRAIYRGDPKRNQTWDDAIASDQAVTAAWRRLGYAVIDLPFGNVAERADRVLEPLSLKLPPQQ